MTAEVDQTNVVFSWQDAQDDMTGIKEYTLTCSNGSESHSFTLKGNTFELKDASYGYWTWSVQAKDNAGNISTAAGEDFAVNPFEFLVIGNPLNWSNTDAILTAAAAVVLMIMALCCF